MHLLFTAAFLQNLARFILGKTVVFSIVFILLLGAFILFGVFYATDSLLEMLFGQFSPDESALTELPPQVRQLIFYFIGGPVLAQIFGLFFTLATTVLLFRMSMRAIVRILSVLYA